VTEYVVLEFGDGTVLLKCMERPQVEQKMREDGVPLYTDGNLDLHAGNWVLIKGEVIGPKTVKEAEEWSF
jgi:hypothetical protein